MKGKLLCDKEIGDIVYFPSIGGPWQIMDIVKDKYMLVNVNSGITLNLPKTMPIKEKYI